MADPKKKPADQKPAPEAAAATPAKGRFRVLKAYRWPLAAAAAVLALGGVGSFWYFQHPSRPEPAVLLARALECLDERDNANAIPEARAIVSELDALKYRDPTFPGAVPYVLGIIHFRKARLQTDRERLDSF